MDLVYAAITLLSLVAAIAAWVAKLRWSKEYGAAKDEIIRGKDAQIAVLNEKIEMLRELTPMKLREHYLSIKQLLEDYNDALRKGLDEAKAEIHEKDQAIVALQAHGTQRSTALSALEQERDHLKEAVALLEEQLRETTALAEAQIEAVSKQAAWEDAAAHLERVLGHTGEMDSRVLESFRKSARELVAKYQISVVQTPKGYERVAPLPISIRDFLDKDAEAKKSKE